MKEYKIGVFGSASGNHTKAQMEMAFLIGKTIAENKAILVTGATFGLPNQAVRGAHSVGGFTLGISPANSKEEHINKYKMPLEDNITVFTGFDFQGRNLINVRTSEAAIFIKGSIGTLNEFTVALKEGKVIGVLTNSGGVSSKLRDITLSLNRPINNIIYSDDSKRLVEQVIDRLSQIRD